MMIPERVAGPQNGQQEVLKIAHVPALHHARFSCIITEWQERGAGEPGISDAFSTGSHPSTRPSSTE